MKTKAIPETMDDYIAQHPPKVRAILKKIRATLRRALPDASEKISYRMPAFAQGKGHAVIYFAAFKSHIGIFPPIRSDRKLISQLKPFAGPKGNLKFPLDQPMPYALIGKVARCRLKEHLK